MKVQVIRSNRKTIGLEVRADESVILRAPQWLSEKELDEWIGEHAYWIEEKVKQKRLHKMHMENRNKLEMTGIVDVISFDLNKVILESDCGMITIKGANLHVSRLSVEKGELDIDGTIESYAYSEVNSYAKKGESMLGRLFR
jgi:sporulation protein YabP